LETKHTNIAVTIQTLLENKKVFVFFKKPNSTGVNLIIQKDIHLYTTTSYDESGFVFAPFDSREKTILFPKAQSDYSIFKLLNKKEIELNKNQVDSTGKAKYVTLLRKAIAFIKVGNADKIVLSRLLNKSYNKETIGLVYESLLQAYPTAYVYIWHHPKVGLWMGATPEKLLEMHDGKFSTMSLAGTQLFTDAIEWETKEKEEQKWVTSFIRKQLKPIVTELEISESFTKKAGHLAHICTEIKGELFADFGIKDLVFSLHPTPAVCGTPRTIATAFILENEGYNRAFYTGFLGEVNQESKTELYVNLRCMQLSNGKAKLYVGGGITKDSLAEKEWEETVVKSAVLGQSLE